jgi:ubiquinone/menaquinone biosynthesis C-methylase UbiE
LGTGLRGTLDFKEIDKEKRVWDERAEVIKDDVELRGPLKNRLAQLEKSIFQICKFFQKSRNKRFFLDVGCGNGLFTVPMTEIFSFVVGIDISKAMIKRCREKRSNMDFVVASATNLPLKDKVFDAILSLSLLQHLRTRQNVEKTLREISRTATSDSLVFLTFWDTRSSPTKFVKETLKKEKYKLHQSLVSKFQFTGLQFTKYVKLKGYKY